jgi:heterodisulfide reductase subunit B
MAKRYWYYPGCTLKSKAKNFEDTTLATAQTLGFEFKEIEHWNCCGTVYSLAEDNLMHKIAPLRNLTRVRDAGDDKMVTLCSMCYNTLKRANLFLQADPLNHRRINNFLDNQTPYNGEVKVFHFLELIKNEVGLEEIRYKVVQPLTGLKVAAYYGCLLVRPPEVGLDDLEHPTILEKIMTELGATVIDDPLKTECCGAYQTVHQPAFTADLVYKILQSMSRNGAEVVITSCPLCQYNLDRRQSDISQRYYGFHKIPILYFTQLMALAFGKDESIQGFDRHYVDPRPLLKSKNLIHDTADVAA